MPDTSIDTSIEIAHVAECATARSLIVVGEPIRVGPDTEYIVVITGQLGTHYMVWRESPAAGSGPTALYHVEPGWQSPDTTSRLAAHGAPDLIGTTDLWSLTGGDLTLTRTIINACRACGERMTYPVIDADTSVTDEQLARLMTEAGEAADLAQVDLCERALRGDQSARAKCEAAILDARAQS